MLTESASSSGRFGGESPTLERSINGSKLECEVKTSGNSINCGFTRGVRVCEFSQRKIEKRGKRSSTQTKNVPVQVVREKKSFIFLLN